jgi:hypothetical protein
MISDNGPAETSLPILQQWNPSIVEPSTGMKLRSIIRKRTGRRPRTSVIINHNFFSVPVTVIIHLIINTMRLTLCDHLLASGR